MNSTTLKLLLLLTLTGCIPKNEKPIADKICDCVSKSKVKDSVKIDNCVQENVNRVQYLVQPTYKKRVDEAFVYLAKNCREFLRLSSLKSQGDWQLTDTIIQQSNLDCYTLLNYNNFYYLETNGDTTRIELNKNIWTEHMSPNFYSKLKFTIKDSCAFTLEFIESNHPAKMKLSHPGEKYEYIILGKKAGYFEIGYKTLGLFYKFKLHTCK